MSHESDHDDTRTLSDDHLKALGLQPVKSWVKRAETPKARRNRRHRERAAAAGIRQLSVRVPDAAREPVRMLCQRLCRGELDAGRLAEVADPAAKTRRRTGIRPRGVVAGWLAGLATGLMLAWLLI